LVAIALIGTTSLRGSNDVLIAAGMIAICDRPARNSVYPSGGARATASAAMAPLAPGRYSMMNGWPNAALSGWATKCAASSVTPPGANGTMILTGRCGQSCACARAGDAIAARMTTDTRHRPRRMIVCPGGRRLEQSKIVPYGPIDATRSMLPATRA